MNGRTRQNEALAGCRQVPGRRAAVSQQDAMRAADALTASHSGAVVEAMELRGGYGLAASIRGAHRVGDVGEVAGWLDEVHAQHVQRTSAR